MSDREITSLQNPGLKEVRKLHRRAARDRTGLFVAEGEDLLAEADAAGWQPVYRYRATDTDLKGTPVATDVLAQVSQLGSSTRTMAVYKQRFLSSASDTGLCLVAWNIHDPGNIGTIIRSALAFGAGLVVLGPESADPYGHKAVRASMGAIFNVKLMRLRGIEDLEMLPRPIVGLVPNVETKIGDVKLASVMSVLVGSEREGVPIEVARKCDDLARIPIRSESLNAAMAATVALYHFSSQSRDLKVSRSLE